MDNNLERELSNFEELLGFYSGRIMSRPCIPPEHVYFSLTNRCCLKCKMCDIAKSPSKIEDELSTGEIKEIILQIKEIGVKHLIFSGGEPLLRKDLLEILEFSVSQGLKMVDIISNGVLLDDRLIQALIRIKLNHITISLDGMQDIHDGIRGAGSFEKSSIGIDRINYYKHKFCSFFPTVGINFTIMNKNIPDILNIVQFARKKKCNIVVFQPVLFNNSKMHEKKRNILWPIEDDLPRLKEVMKQLTSLKSEISDINIYTDDQILNAIPGYFEGKRPGSEFKCYEAIKRIVITYDGKIWSCMGIYGDLKNNTLKDIWFSAQAKSIRERVRKCREHCLQDCVFFPSDISNAARVLLKTIKNEDVSDREKIKLRLLKSINNHLEAISKIPDKRLWLLGRANLNLKMNDLRLIKRSIEKIGLDN
ncbi:MAG: radical SAM protein [Candidatus Omnitrophica bacterium]|nr:radical SAM protein [Candidatus Omnitrophota bacterium]MBU1868873.1 radical SAM protein [Candidatus Omnitrophota bacterium]